LIAFGASHSRSSRVAFLACWTCVALDSLDAGKALISLIAFRSLRTDVALRSKAGDGYIKLRVVAGGSVLFAVESDDRSGGSPA
jgi:hypothetical protein